MLTSLHSSMTVGTTLKASSIKLTENTADVMENIDQDKVNRTLHNIVGEA